MCFCWLVGKVFPSQGDLHIAPFTDEALYMEQCGKANFWSVFSSHPLFIDISHLAPCRPLGCTNRARCISWPEVVTGIANQAEFVLLIRTGLLSVCSLCSVSM